MTTTQNIRPSAIPGLNNVIISPEQKLMNCLKAHIERRFRRHRQTKYYSQLMKLSIQELDMLSLKYCGCPVSGLIQSRLLSEAIVQLIFSSIKIQNISYQLGFTQHSNFNSWFKGHMGLTPGEFRGNIQIDTASLARQLANYHLSTKIITAI